jgi:hypothetical protein
MTNLGIMELSIEVVEFHTGMKAKEIEEILLTLEDKERIYVHEETNELVVRNWLKHNITTSPTLQSNIEKTFGMLKEKGLVILLYGIDTLPIVSITTTLLKTKLEDFGIEKKKRDETLPIPMADSKFKRPTEEELQSLIDEKGYIFRAEAFLNHYDSNGWKVGRVAMKDWKKAAANWNLTETQRIKEKEERDKKFDESRNKPRVKGQVVPDVEISWLDDYVNSLK